jgi:uncharacterized protein YjbI with pentapeptide repeats
MSEKKRCKYYCEKTVWRCPYDALDDSNEGLCIFHEKRKGRDIEKFNQGVKNILEDKKTDVYHFEGFFFPSTIDFSELKFGKDVYFTRAKFCGKSTYFDQAEFSGEYTGFDDVEFGSEYVSFFKVKFSGKYTWFQRAKFSAENTSFVNAEFSSEDTDFQWSQFSGPNTDFSNAKFSGERTNFNFTKFAGKNTHFAGARFLGSNTDFSEVKFAAENTDFSWAIFSGQNTDFSSAEFSGWNTNFSNVGFTGEKTNLRWVGFSGKKVNFYYPEFLRKIIFDRTVFKAKTNFTAVDLRKCIFREVDLKNVDFSLLDWDWNHKLGNETEKEKILEKLVEKQQEFYFKTSEIYRQLKVQFHNKRDFAKAGMFHFREQECKRKACKLPIDFFKWIFLWILRLSCGYGEKLRNVGLSSIALVLIFGIIYMFLGLHNTDQNESLLFQYSLKTSTTTSLGTILKDFWTSLIFSVKGFFPLWRFQQYKVVGDFANLVAGIEFLLGAFMVGLFVYVFRRRMDK